MDISLIVFLVIIIIFSFRGYRKGSIVLFSGIVSMLAAYGVAFFFSVPVGKWLQETSPFQGFLSYAVAGMLLFIGTSAITSYLLKLIIIKSSKKPLGHVSQLSSLTGAIFGAVIGAVFGVIVIWFYGTMQGIMQTNHSSLNQPSPFQGKIKKIVGKALHSIVKRVAEGNELASSGAILLSDPAANIKRIQRLSQGDLFKNVLNNGAVRNALDNRNPGALMETPAFQELVNNEDFAALSGGFSKGEKGQGQRDIAEKFVKLWTQVKHVQTDPRYISIINDPEIKDMVETGSTYKMLNSPKVEELWTIISSVEVPEGYLNEADRNEVNRVDQPAETSVYRWVDENGTVHYSDKKNSQEESQSEHQ